LLRGGPFFPREVGRVSLAQQSKNPQQQTRTPQLIFLRLPFPQSGQLPLPTTIRGTYFSQMTELPSEMFLSRGSFSWHSSRSRLYLFNKMTLFSDCLSFHGTSGTTWVEIGIQQEPA
jgi:hypothetical protein